MSFLRFGAGRLLSVRREFPPRETAAPDLLEQVQRQLLGDAAGALGVATTAGASTPPPGA